MQNVLSGNPELVVDPVDPVDLCSWDLDELVSDATSQSSAVSSVRLIGMKEFTGFAICVGRAIFLLCASGGGLGMLNRELISVDPQLLVCLDSGSCCCCGWACKLGWLTGLTSVRLSYNVVLLLKLFHSILAVWCVEFKQLSLYHDGFFPDLSHCGLTVPCWGTQEVSSVSCVCGMVISDQDWWGSLLGLLIM